MSIKFSHPVFTLIVATAALTLMSSHFIGTSVGQQIAGNAIRDLPPDEILDRELAGGETQRYKIKLSAGEFFQVRVDQKGVDVALKLVDSGGQSVATIDSPNGKEGHERLSFIARAPGNFMLTVNATDPKAEKGTYSIRREVPRTATPRDRQRVDVELLFTECLEQSATKDVVVRPKVIAKCKEAVRGWEELQDLYMFGLASRQVERLKSTQWRETSDQRLAEAIDAPAPIPVDKPVTRPLSDEDGFHAYKTHLVAGSVLHVSVRELNVNVFLTVSKYQKPPAKDPIIWSNFGSAHGREIATLIASETGEYVILISAVGGRPLRGHYELLTRVADSATENDRLKVKAEELNRTTIRLSNLSTVEGLRKAIANRKEESEIWQKIGEPFFAASCENRIGLNSYELGERQQALDHYQNALRLFNVVGDQSGKGNALNNIGNVYLALRDKTQALDYYQQALVLLRVAGDRAGEANTLSNIGLAYSALGEKKKALEFFRLALPIRREVGARDGEATTLASIAAVYQDLGEHGRALAGYSAALEFAQGFYDRRREATALQAVGNVYFVIKNWQKALEFYHKALTLRRAMGTKLEQAGTMTNIGSSYSQLGNKQKALEYLTEALTIFQAEKSRTGEGVSLVHLGGLYFDAGDHSKAFEAHRQALSLFVANGDPIREMQALNSIRKHYNLLKLQRPAAFFGKLGVNKIQELRLGIKDLDTDNQKNFLRSVETAYLDLTEILLDSDQLEQALEVLNLYRNQQFYDFDRGSVESGNRLSFSPREARIAERYRKESEKLRKSTDRIEELKLKIGSRKPTDQETAERDRLQREYDGSSLAFVKILEEVLAEFSKPVDDQDKVPVAEEVKRMREAIRQVNAATGTEAVSIYTLIGEKQLRLVLATSNELKSFVSPINRAEFSSTIRRFHAVLQAPNYDPRPLGKQVYDVLLKPIEADLKRLNARVLLWALDGNLRYVPMAALSPDGQHYSAEQYQHVLFTRANPELITHMPNSTWTGTGFGSSRPQVVELTGEGTQVSFPPLPGVLTELEDIFGRSPRKGILPGSVLIDDKFTKASFYSALRTRRPVVHISGHFSFRPGDSSHSFLVLGDGKALSLEELKQQTDLFHGIELLTLSACNTAANRADADGREIDGFAELVQRMGANAVMATLWEVNDNSTPLFMREFYRNRLLNAEQTKSEALRQSQISLLTGEVKTKPLPNARNGSALRAAKLVIVADNAKELHTSNELNSPSSSSQVIYVAQKDAPKYERSKATPFAHPYYWAPFILIGNWR